MKTEIHSRVIQALLLLLFFMSAELAVAGATDPRSVTIQNASRRAADGAIFAKQLKDLTPNSKPQTVSQLVTQMCMEISAMSSLVRNAIEIDKALNSELTAGIDMLIGLLPEVFDAQAFCADTRNAIQNAQLLSVKLEMLAKELKQAAGFI